MCQHLSVPLLVNALAQLGLCPIPLLLLRETIGPKGRGSGVV